MNLINEKVEHKQFGLGVVISVDLDKASVKFPEPHGIKTFLYPDAFEQFLKFENSKIAETVLEEVNHKKKQTEFEKEMRKAELQKDAETREQDKLEQAKLKKKAAAKTTKAATTATKKIIIAKE